MGKQKICIDFDGVIHLFIQPWISEDIIPDLPVSGIKEVIDQLRKLGYEVVVMSSRALTEKGKTAIRDYLNKYNITVDDIVSEKIPAMVYVDDRCIQFTGNTTGLVDQIINFKPWNR